MTPVFHCAVAESIIHVGLYITSTGTRIMVLNKSHTNYKGATIQSPGGGGGAGVFFK